LVGRGHADGDDEMSWAVEAACRGPQASEFFPPMTSEHKDDRLARERRAKTICATCTVRTSCLDHALRTQESHGIWGGLNELERRGRLDRHDLDRVARRTSA
jgi:WhiB family transcriptional regulator, redox-sensing transcriptional regulator